MEGTETNPESDPALDYLPDNLEDSTIRDLEFTVAITSGNNPVTSSAPLLDALTSYREQELN
jgi:hypothetical protein